MANKKSSRQCEICHSLVPVFDVENWLICESCRSSLEPSERKKYRIRRMDLRVRRNTSSRNEEYTTDYLAGDSDLDEYWRHAFTEGFLREGDEDESKDE